MVPTDTMAKITPVLWTYKKAKDGSAPIWLRVADSEGTLYYTLGESVKERHWSKRTQRVRKSHRKHAALNARIAEAEAEAARIVAALERSEQEVTAKAIVEALRGERKVTQDYFSYADEVIDRLERRGQIYTHKRYKSVCKKLREWTGEPLPFEDLTVNLLRRYETHLIEHYDNAPSTVASNFRAIRAILYRAIEDGLASQEDNPFFSFKIKQGKTERTKLSLQQIKALEELELEALSREAIARDTFLFSFYAAGIRFGDVCRLQWQHIHEGDEETVLSYEMSKTGKRKEVPLMPQAVAILQRYRTASSQRETRIFPLLIGYTLKTARDEANAIASQNALVNRALKKLAERVGIEESVSFHISRHSFADLVRRKGWDLYSIRDALGHSSLRVTEKYLAGFDERGLSDKMNSLFGGENE